MPHIPAKYAKAALALAQALTGPLTQRDRDAFGVAAIDASGELYHGRWLPNEAWSKAKRPLKARLQPQYSNLLPSAPRPRGGLVSGTLPTAPQAMLLHARFATSGKALSDAHPHVSPAGDAALIHNGVVDTLGLDLRRTACDSEGILNAYTDANCVSDPTEMQTALDRVMGYYALGVLALVDGRWVCDIVRDDRASLEYVELPQLHTGIYITDRAILQVTAKNMGMRLGAHYQVAPNSHVRIDCATGVEVYAGSIAPAKRAPAWGAKTNKLAELALAGNWTDDVFLPTHT